MESRPRMGELNGRRSNQVAAMFSFARDYAEQARFEIENDPPAAAAVKTGATLLPDAYEAARERLAETRKRRRLDAGGTLRARHDNAMGGGAAAVRGHESARPVRDLAWEPTLFTL